MVGICTYEEINWFSKADFDMYTGKYVAIIDKKVVAFGDNAKTVWGDAKKKFPDKNPVLAKIPEEDLLIYCCGNNEEKNKEMKMEVI